MAMMDLAGIHPFLISRVDTTSPWDRGADAPGMPTLEFAGAPVEEFEVEEPRAAGFEFVRYRDLTPD